MASFAQDQLPAVATDSWNSGVVIACEGGFGENAIELIQGICRGRDFTRMFAESVTDFGEYAFDLTDFVFAQANELIIKSDRFERLDKECVARAARTMNDTIDTAFLTGNNRDHETVVPDGDK